MIAPNVFFKILSCFTLLVLFFPTVVNAQRCDVNPEAIFKLHKADIGAYAIWDAVHGDEGFEERYAGGALLDHGHTVVTGTRTLMAKPYPVMILAEVDRRGRVVWETKRDVKGLKTILSTARFGKDIVVTALISEGRDVTSFWVGLFDQRGALRTSRVFRHKGGSVVFGDVIESNKSGALVMVLSTKEKRSGVPRFSGFYNLNSKLQVISKRDFKPGPDNGMYSIIPTPDDQYLLSGYIDNARGRKSGWLMKLDQEGGIIWQQQYPRGIGGEFLRAAVMPDGSYIAIGTALPAQEDALKAGWVVNLDPDSGQVIWQRYFTGDLDYSGKDVLISDDGVISVMLEAAPFKNVYEKEGEKAKSYTRLMTLGPRGVIFDSQAYFQGEIATAFDLFLGPMRDRILVGYTQIAYQKDGVEVSGSDEKSEDQGPIVKRSDEGWIISAPPVKPYEDPCKSKKPRDLDSFEREL